MYRRLLMLAIALFTFLAQISVVSACNVSGYQPSLPEALRK
ncbi:hypothetical protein Tfer_2309 [Thermincola ferriacetica]|uniref:Cyclic lactone autoinducer peptide n=1 Tax=Thermincola ferriacetica TaxID=281456 RepID=A0A0L6W103_9FIRM|nr:cyclic lactone autoinducer peptide [Thermincola ferriacetica]KNZ69063.1 hypothetical protein Tfer_2309 [Thermincola ferriacetica]